jgi:hypothetical protein
MVIWQQIQIVRSLIKNILHTKHMISHFVMQQNGDRTLVQV